MENGDFDSEIIDVDQFSIESGATAVTHWDGYMKDSLMIKERSSDTLLEINMAGKISQTNTFVVILYVKARGNNAIA